MIGRSVATLATMASPAEPCQKSWVTFIFIWAIVAARMAGHEFTTSGMSHEKQHIFAVTFQRFRKELILLARSSAGPQAFTLLGCLILLMLAINGMNVLNSYVGRDFMSAIEHKDEDGFGKFAWLYICVFACSTVLGVYFRFCESRLSLLWRGQLTRRFMESYMSQRTYYKLDADGKVANPDQRIAEDVNAFTTTTLSFILLILNGTMTAVSFSGVLWSISPLLFGVAVAYAMGGSLFAIWLGRPLIRLNYNQLDMEANFRAALIHVRENSESIALSHREGRFKARLNKRLDELILNMRRLIGVNRNLGFFTTGYNYLIQIIPALLVAPLFMQDKVEFGVITQSAMAFATLLGAFSLIVTQFQSISAFTAVTARLYGLSEAIDKAMADKSCDIKVVEHPSEIAFANVTLRSQDQSRVLVEKLNITIPLGARWVITGRNDEAKLALFRAIAGIWPCGEGSIARPCLEEILFLPERPYLPPGTLREVLLRTGKEAMLRDERIYNTLEQLGIGGLAQRVGGLNADQDWDDMLSIGEQHLLAIARIFLAEPTFVVLDRPGSALPKNQILKIFDMLRERGIGVLVLAKNGESHLRYDVCLDIEPEGKWSVRKVSQDTNEDYLENLSC